MLGYIIKNDKIYVVINAAGLSSWCKLKVETNPLFAAYVKMVCDKNQSDMMNVLGKDIGRYKMRPNILWKLFIAYMWYKVEF